ncbi:MAG: LysR family transcriptional regulator [Candidatus Asgardarchaeia archaeon]
MTVQQKKLKLRIKLWLEYNGEHILGEGGYHLLKAIKDEGSIASAAEKLGVSYKFAWNYIKRIEKLLGESVVYRYKGGATRGGAELTEVGEFLLETYKRFYKELNICLGEARQFSVLGFAKNYIDIKIKEIKQGTNAAIIRGVIPKNTDLIAVITNESLSKLRVNIGVKYKLLIKATSIRVVI